MKATITKILGGILSLHNESTVTPPISIVEKVYTERLEKGNQSEINPTMNYPLPQNTSRYGRRNEKEIRTCRGEMNRKTASAPDLA